jgi:hypothetical protein
MQTIRTKYIQPGNVRGSRVSATAAGGSRVIIEWDDALNFSANHEAAVRALCAKLKWSGRFHGGGLKDGSQVWVFDNGDDALIVK